MGFLYFLIQIVVGAAAGNVAMGFRSGEDFPLIGRTVAGAVGGVILGQLLPVLMPQASAGGFDLTGVLGQVVASALGGGGLSIAVAQIYKMIGGR